MAPDPFDDLLDLEQNFYQEGYDAGIADGEHAGFVEGKIFGIEKGYEKALELGKLYGRATVWQMRSQKANESSSTLTTSSTSSESDCVLDHLRDSKLPKNARLAKHIESLLSVADGGTIAPDNSDESVTEFDDRISKAQAKAKVIAAIVSESLQPEARVGVSAGIEDAQGLNARH